MVRRGLVVGALILFAGGCASLPMSCPAGGRERAVAELLFGRNIGGGVGVSQAAFRRFIDAEVTPRFPDGLTILDAHGQYRDAARAALVREPSKVVLIVLDDEARDAPRLVEIADAYKRRFRQQSVGIITRRSCVAF